MPTLFRVYFFSNCFGFWKSKLINLAGKFLEAPDIVRFDSQKSLDTLWNSLYYNCFRFIKIREKNDYFRFEKVKIF